MREDGGDEDAASIEVVDRAVLADASGLVDIGLVGEVAVFVDVAMKTSCGYLSTIIARSFFGPYVGFALRAATTRSSVSPSTFVGIDAGRLDRPTTASRLRSDASNRRIHRCPVSRLTPSSRQSSATLTRPSPASQRRSHSSTYFDRSFMTSVSFHGMPTVRHVLGLAKTGVRHLLGPQCQRCCRLLPIHKWGETATAA